MQKLERILPGLGRDAHICADAKDGVVSKMELQFDVQGNIDNPTQYLHDLAARLAD